MEKEFLFKLAEAYQKYDASIIKDYLADDMLSINVGPEITSKKEYLDYLTRTLHAMKMHNVQMEFEIVQGRMHRYALLITAYSGDSRSPIPMISVHSVGYLLYRRQS